MTSQGQQTAWVDTMPSRPEPDVSNGKLLTCLRTEAWKVGLATRIDFSTDQHGFPGRRLLLWHRDHHLPVVSLKVVPGHCGPVFVDQHGRVWGCAADPGLVAESVRTVLGNVDNMSDPQDPENNDDEFRDLEDEADRPSTKARNPWTWIPW